MPAFLLISYGSPELRAEIAPFLERLLRGKKVPAKVFEETVREYEELARQTGRFSPLGEECRRLLTEILAELNKAGQNSTMPVYWGNLFWYPLLEETVAEMVADGVQEATALIAVPFEAARGNRHYLEAIEQAARSAGPIRITPLPSFGTDPLYIRAVTERLLEAAAWLSLEAGTSLAAAGVRILFTAHSLPGSESENAYYLEQLRESCQKVVQSIDGEPLPWELVFQSRGKGANRPWLGPDLDERIRELAREHSEAGKELSLIFVPIGFLLENKETAYDLDVRAMGLCEELGVRAARAATAGASPPILRMIRERILEQSKRKA